MTKPDKNGNEEFDCQVDLTCHNPGKPDNYEAGGGVFVEINQVSSSFILDYSRSDTSQELAGVLLGHYTEKGGQYHVFVDAAIEARYTEAAKGSVTFTHRSWDYINSVLEEKYPQLSIVGWFHTHPGFGIFLSGYDKFIHNNFFNLPWQIAYVIDPLAGKHGFFGWSNSNLVKVPFNSAISPQDLEKRKTLAQETKKKPSLIGKVAMAAAITFFLISSIYFYMTNQEVNRQLGELQVTYSGLKKDLSSLQAENMILLEEKKELESKLKEAASIEGIEPAYYVYTIVEGDTLWNLSEQYLGDGQLYKTLAGLNNLADPDSINVGGKLIIPALEIIEGTGN